MMNNKEKRETVGKISYDILSKPQVDVSPIDVEKEAHKDYERNIFDCVSRGKRDYHDDFFVVVITKKERLMENVIRHYFFCRKSCPTPDYDQAVYSYNFKDDKIDFLWVIPSKDTCLYLIQHASQVVPEEWSLLDFVLKFADGTLFKIAKTLNNEKVDSSLLDQ